MEFKLDPELIKQYEEAQKRLDERGNVRVNELVDLAVQKTNPLATELFNDALNFRLTGNFSELLMKNLKMWVLVVGDATAEQGVKILAIDRQARLVHVLVPFSEEPIRRKYFSTIVKKILGSDWGVDYKSGIMALNANKRRTTSARRKKTQSKRTRRTQKNRK